MEPHPIPWAAVATRSIVTSQPDVPCDVCGRRLLRGEQPDVFLAGGRRRTVCELCAPRASHEGWLRETDSLSLSLPPARPRRGRNLLDRLRQREPVAPPNAIPALPEDPGETASYDFFDGGPGAAELSAPGVAESQAPDFTQTQTAEPVPAMPSDLQIPSGLEQAAEPEPEPVRGESPSDDPEGQAVPAQALSEDGAPEAIEPHDEDGSWRDAWMFVGE